MLYLDHAATSYPKPACVLRAVREALLTCGNPGRGSHSAEKQAEGILYRARETLCCLFHTEDPLNYIFTLNATDALNLAIHGLIRPGSKVVTSPMEHNSVLRPLFTAREEGLIRVEILPTDPLGRIDTQALERALTPDCALVALNHASNVTGILQPVEEAAALCRRHGIPILIDGSQAAGHFDIDLSALDPDFYACPGHKGLLGPQGTGVLYLSGRYLPRPLRQGGTGSESQLLTQPETLPERYEAGTAAVPAIAGLAAGVDFLCDHRKELLACEQELFRELREGLLTLPGCTLYGLPEASVPTAPVLSLNLQGRDPSLAAEWLEEHFALACRVGLHCAPLAHQLLGSYPTGSLRLSLGALSRRRDVKSALDALAALGRM